MKLLAEEVSVLIDQIESEMGHKPSPLLLDYIFKVINHLVVEGKEYSNIRIQESLKSK
jgi:hypothetical protein